MTSWWRFLTDPRMPGSDDTTLPWSTTTFVLMTLVMVPIGLGRYFFGVLDRSDDQALTVLLGLGSCLVVLAAAHGPTALRRVDTATWRTLAIGTALYMLIWYVGRMDFFEDHVRVWLGKKRTEVLIPGFAWFCLNHLFMLLGPALLLGWWLDGRRPRDLGLGLTGDDAQVEHPMWPLYLAAFFVVLPFIVYAGTTSAFIQRYPLFRVVIDDNTIGLGELLLCEAMYLSVFVCVEGFFRGYLVFGMERGLGAYALPLAAVPYVAGHFGKPMPEAMGAILTAMLLGWAALKHRSVWLGVAVHVGVAIVMDVMAFMGRGTTILW